MSDSIAIPSSYYSITNSVIPCSVLTSYSYHHGHHVPSRDDEPDYPANYEASPVGEYHDINADTADASFPSSLLTSADVDNKEEFIYDSQIVKAMETESQMLESRHKSFHDTHANKYCHMKMKYLRSAGIAIPNGVAGAIAAARRLSSSPVYEAEDITATGNDTRTRAVSSSSPSSSSSSPAVVSPSTGIPKSGSVGLLARLLSERAVTSAPPSPTTLSPSSSSTSLASMTSSSVAAVVATSVSVSVADVPSSSIIPSYVRRTSPISIPKRMSSNDDDSDGVRYRRARPITRDDLAEEENDRRRYGYGYGAAATPAVDIPCRKDDGEFTFADVFAVPLATSSRPQGIPCKSVAVSGRRRAPASAAIIPSSSMMSVRDAALPSSLLDGFLAL